MAASLGGVSRNRADRCNSSSSANRSAFRQWPTTVVATLTPMLLVRRQLYYSTLAWTDKRVESATPNRLFTKPSTTTSSTIKVGANDATFPFSSSFVVVVCVMNRSSRARFFFCSFLLYFCIFFFSFWPGQQFVTVMCHGTIKMMARPPTPANQNNAFNFVCCWMLPVITIMKLRGKTKQKTEKDEAELASFQGGEGNLLLIIISFLFFLSTTKEMLNRKKQNNRLL